MHFIVTNSYNTNMQTEILDNVYLEFGNIVRERRISMGLTQEKLADEAGINRVSLAKLEKGKQRILFHDAIKLSSILGISVDQLKEQLSSKIIIQRFKEQPKSVQKQLSKLEIFGDPK